MPGIGAEVPAERAAVERPGPVPVLVGQLEVHDSSGHHVTSVGMAAPVRRGPPTVYRRSGRRGKGPATGGSAQAGWRRAGRSGATMTVARGAGHRVRRDGLRRSARMAVELEELLVADAAGWRDVAPRAPRDVGRRVARAAPEGRLGHRADLPGGGRGGAVLRLDRRPGADGATTSSTFLRMTRRAAAQPVVGEQRRAGGAARRARAGCTEAGRAAVRSAQADGRWAPPRRRARTRRQPASPDAAEPGPLDGWGRRGQMPAVSGWSTARRSRAGATTSCVTTWVVGRT